MILVDHGDDGALVHRLAGGGFAQQALIGEAAGVPILLGVSAMRIRPRTRTLA